MSLVQNGDILIKIGPRGDVYSKCDDWDEVCYGSVQQILVMHGKAINSIQMAYNLNGVVALAHRHGGDGDKFDCISLEPWETLTGVSGHYAPVDETYFPAVRSIKFVSNRTSYGPFGVEEGTPFSFKLDSGVTFGGFHGRSSPTYLRAIGVYAKSNARHHFQPDPSRSKTLPALCSASK
uniref:Agglutinin n=1 Tax=Anthurium amnicola TaxID=1678845 RepID=A0A1D1ZBN3_9ARAE